ncbi:MAG: hypothetical protein ABL908_02340 [Hyphomicrobium sp.]
MLKTMTLAVALAGLANVALAQAVPVNSDECLKQAFQLAQTAESKKLTEDKFDKIEELLTKMESHCDAKLFTEATTIATDIKAAIDAN